MAHPDPLEPFSMQLQLMLAPFDWHAKPYVLPSLHCHLHSHEFEEPAQGPGSHTTGQQSPSLPHVSFGLQTLLYVHGWVAQGLTPFLHT
jgi:hypothetical protein